MRKISLIFSVFLLASCVSGVNEEAAPVQPDSTASSSSSFSSGSVIVLEGEQWTEPVERSAERVTLKPFGIQVSQDDSPVQDEKFNGYHTGTDFELLENEDAASVVVRASCNGEVFFVEWVSGYGGVVVQRCILSEKPVTVLYGHLNIDAIEVEKGQSIVAGTPIGVLGEGFGPQTDGERPHLHFAIHRGESLNVRGYVSSEISLKEWINPADVSMVPASE